MMSHRGGNNNNKKRPRNNSGWGPYYANQRQNRKDRHAELDSSAATAINVGPKPTLAKRRRQLADDKWESSAKRKEYADEICKELRSKHPEKTTFGQRTPTPEPYASAQLLKSREKLWKRRLSNLSTKQYDAVWKEGRNQFLGGQIFRYCKYVQSYDEYHNKNTESAHDLLQKYSIKDSWKCLFPKQRFPDVTTGDFENVWKMGRNMYLADRIYLDLKKSHGDERVKSNLTLISSKKADWKKELSKLSPDDFDEAWKLGRNTFFKEIHGHDSKGNTATGGPSKPEVATSTTTATTAATTSTTTTTRNNIIDKDHDKKSMERAQKQIPSSSSTNETRSSIPNDHEVIDLCDSDSEDEPETGETSNSSVQSSEHIRNLPRAKQEVVDTSTEETRSPNDVVPPAAAVPTQTSLAITANRYKTKTPPSNRWSKLFLGPDFRTDFIFSLDEECF